MVALRTWRKLGIIAGGGDLPIRLAEHCAAAASPYYVARITPYADAGLSDHPGGDFGLGAMSARFSALKREGCDAVLFAGIVTRPDFKRLQLDARAALLLPKVLAAAGRGDDALLRVLIGEFEREGFLVVGADDVVAPLLAGVGVLGSHAPDEQGLADIAKGAAAAHALGVHDIGQGVVVCDGLILAAEAQEGTDQMLLRVGALPLTLRGGGKRGVLVKRPKPGQERRIDLPTIGRGTVSRIAEIGLAGAAVEAGGALILDREDVLRQADDLGIFLYGFDPALGAAS